MPKLLQLKYPTPTAKTRQIIQPLLGKHATHPKQYVESKNHVL